MDSVSAIARHHEPCPRCGRALRIACYPLTSWGVPDPLDMVGLFRLPVLVLAGEHDTYRSCCLIGTARKIEDAARQRGALFTLVVYPNAEHGFATVGPNYRAHDETDAWARVLDTLKRDHGQSE